MLIRGVAQNVLLWGFLFFFPLCFSSEAKVWITVQIKNPKGALAYVSPKVSAEKAGLYEYGLNLKVFSSPHAGFFAVPVVEGNKEPRYLYISKEDVEFLSGEKNGWRDLNLAFQSSQARVWEISPQIDVMNLIYHRVGITDYQGNPVRIGLNVTYAKKEAPLEIGLSASYNLLMMSRSRAGVDSNQTLAHARVGYRFFFGKLEAGLFAGFNLNQLTLSGTDLGYSSIYYFDIYPRLKFQIIDSLGLSVIGKYTPLSGLKNLDQRQVYTQVLFTYKPYQIQHSAWSIGFETDDLNFSASDGSRFILKKTAILTRFNYEF